jgi:hypothetical protein
VGLFKKRWGPEDFYGFVYKAVGAKAIADNSGALHAMELRWRAEFTAYGLTAKDYVHAWLTPPQIDPLVSAWADHIAFLEQHDYVAMQIVLTKVFERTHGMPISATVPPTFVVTAWKLAGCPEAPAFLNSDSLWLIE